MWNEFELNKKDHSYKEGTLSVREWNPVEQIDFVQLVTH